MEKTDLLALHKLSALSPRQLKTKAPKLFKAFEKLAAGRAHPEPAPEATPAREDTPIKDLPHVQGELRRAEVLFLGTTAKLRTKAIDRVMEKISLPRTLDDQTIGALVEAGALEPHEARSLGLASSVFHLVDGNLDLVGALADRRFPRLPSGKVADVRDLATLGQADWKALLDEEGVSPPEGATRRAYADALVDRVGALFPTDALLAQVVPPAGARLKVSELPRIAKRFPGLGVEEIVQDKKRSAASKIKAVERRIDLLTEVTRRNPDTELLSLDYSPDSADLKKLKLTGLSDDERASVLKTLKAYQRAQGLTRSVTNAAKILEAGYHSSSAIVDDGVEVLATKARLSIDDAQEVHERARAKLGVVTSMMGTVIDLIQNQKTPFAMDNSAARAQDPPPKGKKPKTPVTGPKTPPPAGGALQDYLKKLDGYADLFGSQTSCKCDECQSILSAAAYFVDLMSFIDDNVLKPTFGAGKKTHPLNLEVRRPDLWDLELSCENTNTLIPTLEIVNEILENSIARKVGYVGPLRDRPKVTQRVYQDTLATTARSFKQPFVFPLETLQIYLEHFERSRADVARTIGAVPEVVARATLGMSNAEYALVTQPNTSQTFHRKLYGIDFAFSANGAVTPFDAQALLKPMGLTRRELGEVCRTRYVTANGAVAVKIVPEKTDPSATGSVQNDIERIKGLTVAALDRLHRFTRLWRRLPWSVPELDLVLTELGAAGITTGITTGAVPRLASFVTLQKRLGATVEEACALVSDLPRLKVDEATPALFDRLFNVAPFVLAGTFPQATTKFIHSSFRQSGNSSPVDSGLNRLLAGLRVSDQVLLQLIIHLASPLGVNLNATTESAKGFILDVRNLTLLYRHARLVERLALSVPDLFQLIEQAGVPAKFVDSMDALSVVLEFHDWWKTTSYSLNDLGLITGEQVQKAAAQSDAAQLVDGLIQSVEDDNALAFADTLFAFAGLTESQSREIIEGNANVFEAVGVAGSFRLKTAFTPDLAVALTVPDDISATAAAKKATSDQLKTALLKYHTREIVLSRLARDLTLEKQKAAALVAMTGIDLSSAACVLALQGSGPPTRLIALVEILLPLRALFAPLVFDSPALAFVFTRPDVFGIADFADVGMDSVRQLAVYVELADTSDQDRFLASIDGLPPEEARRAVQADLRAVLEAFAPTQRKFVGVDAELAKVLGVEERFVAALVTNVMLTSTAPSSLAKLKACLELAAALGVGGESLRCIASDDYEELARATDALLGAFRAKYEEENEYQKAVEPFADRVRSRKRDALADYLVRTDFPEFETLNDLYHYFLIDVEMEGCGRTSRVVSAISSAQLYVHRCLMNLEQDRHTPAQVHVLPTLVPAEEWVWRKNFRVWQANRKVFLFPENYIEPGLRDDKTPLFKELESKLLQQEVNEQNVLDAYATYLSGFEEVAKLEIAGAYHDVGTQSDRMHIIGVTAGDPPVYYYRSVDNSRHRADPPTATRVPLGVLWSPWRKIDVQIPVKKVVPLVRQGRLYIFWMELSASPRNQLADGKSTFVGYKHKLTVKFTIMRPDGTWTTPQPIPLRDDGTFPNGPGVVMETATGEPIEDHVLQGYAWDQVYPGEDYREELRLAIIGVDRGFVLDLPRRTTAVKTRLAIGHTPWLLSLLGNSLRLGSFDGQPTVAEGSYPSSHLNDLALRQVFLNATSDLGLHGATFGGYAETLLSNIQGPVGASLANADFHDTSFISYFLASKDECFLIQGPYSNAKYSITRVGTTPVDRAIESLFKGGLDRFLDINKSQLTLNERPNLPFTLTGSRIQNDAPLGKLDFTGPYGGYYREVFFHTPFLVADHLNSQQKFAAAQKWYHYIFDPTASDPVTPPRDSNWRYRELRGVGVPKLRETLTERNSIELYKKDPFNPHAIARLRLSAYQKAIVMKYVDNLLDWGDSLFAQFTPEAVNEATLLYVMAADILGDRPAELGDCGQEQVTSRTFRTIAPLIKKGSEFLIELETLSYAPGAGSTAPPASKLDYRYTVEDTKVREASRAKKAKKAAPGQDDLLKGEISKGTDWTSAPTSAVSDGGQTFTMATVDLTGPAIARGAIAVGWTLVKQISPVFCVPANSELGQYWDRVADRLFKIRNCMDISGVRRQMALFPPEIDPRLLVRAKAAGLSLDDVLNATSGNLPPYRFTYLIDKAKSYAGTIQSFGSALMSALEKKDVEELTRLRAVHEQNILKLTTQVKEREIKDAGVAIEVLERQRDSVQFRKDHYESLRATGLNAWERVQQVSQHVATGLTVLEATLGFLSGVLHLIPDIGSPFAMKYGGSATGTSAQRFAAATGSLGDIARAMAVSAGLEGGNQRRDEEWGHQAGLADRELKQLEKQIAAAGIRKEIAEKSLQIHQTSIAQSEEVFEYYGSKFSSFGLYTWLSERLQGLYRDAYNSAFAVARLAEQAYQFERGDQDYVLDANYWEPSKAGLLAGERLLGDLQKLELQFLEKNYRELELQQSFSLSEMDPAALLALRESGECQFKLGEIFFDLVYPGQYRRRIKAVRVTVPCVTGPYTNVGAALTLLGSEVRANPGDANMRAIPPTRTVSIATSKAQNDAGVFEFSFRDERYMPFEGAGAVSEWHMALPKAFRAFDYQSISDVILHVDYTALFDGGLRQQVEANNITTERALLKYFRSKPLFRVLSLRHEFPTVFQRLMRSPVDTEIDLKLSKRYFPSFLGEAKLLITKANLALRTPPAQSMSNFRISVNNSVRSGFVSDPDLAGLRTNPRAAPQLETLFADGPNSELTLSVSNPGDLAPQAQATPAPDAPLLSPDKVLDVLLYLEYQIAPP